MIQAINRGLMGMAEKGALVCLLDGARLGGTRHGFWHRLVFSSRNIMMSPFLWPTEQGLSWREEMHANHPC